MHVYHVLVSFLTYLLSSVPLTTRLIQYDGLSTVLVEMGIDPETALTLMQAQLARGPRADWNSLGALLEVLGQLEIERQRRLAEEQADRARVRGNILDLVDELEACQEENKRLVNVSHAALTDFHKEIENLLKIEEERMCSLQSEIG